MAAACAKTKMELLIAEPALDPDREDWEVARDQALITLLYGCGLRISEALSLTRGDAPLGATLRITGKGGKTRIVPVLPIVREAIEAAVAFAKASPLPQPEDALQDVFAP